MTRRIGNLHLLWLGAVLLLPVGLVGAQSPSASPQPVENLREKILEEKTAVEAELEAIKATLQSAQKEAAQPTEQIQREIALLTEIDLVLGQMLAALEQRDALVAVREQNRQDIKRLRASGPVEERPYRFVLLESIRDQLATASERAANSETAIAAAKDAVVAARQAYEDREKERRQARDRLDKNGDTVAKSRLNRALHIAQLESRAANANLRLRELELENFKIEQEAINLEKEFLTEKLDYLASAARFEQEGLEEFLAKIERREYELNQALDMAKRVLETRDNAWMEVRRRLDAAAVKDPILTEEVEAKRLARQAKQREVTLLSRQLQLLVDARTIWNRRFDTFNKKADSDTLRAWAEETRQSAAQITRDIRRYSTELTELRKQNVTLDTRIAGAADSPELQRLLETQKRHASEISGAYEKALDQLEASRRLHEKLLAEIETQISTVTWSQRLGDIWKTTKTVWTYELTSIQDNPITVSKVVTGLILLIAGTILARFIANWVGSRFLPRLGLDTGAAVAIQSLFFYGLVLFVAMVSLRIVNVPLTAFTILGGALAIGIGFGSQNIVNNFISGLILLTERPIRVGDLVQLEDLIGVIHRIGLRSTRVRGSQNTDIIVPNSSFLEKNVVNWTLSDDRFRAYVSVGVAYGSPTRDVSRLIKKAVTDHGKVIAKPEPIVLFNDFGDNALLFEVHFWIRMRQIMDRRIIESDIRHRIDSLFREANIVIAFPQRDVHLDAHRPLEVLLRSAEGEARGVAPGESPSAGESSDSAANPKDIPQKSNRGG